MPLPSSTDTKLGQGYSSENDHSCLGFGWCGKMENILHKGFGWCGKMENILHKGSTICSRNNFGELIKCNGILEGLDKFFKSILCCYNTFKINSIFIIHIHLSFIVYKITLK
jgi:hypothetical protein